MEHDGQETKVEFRFTEKISGGREATWEVWVTEDGLTATLSRLNADKTGVLMSHVVIESDGKARVEHQAL